MNGPDYKVSGSGWLCSYLSGEWRAVCKLTPKQLSEIRDYVKWAKEKANDQR